MGSEKWPTERKGLSCGNEQNVSDSIPRFAAHLISKIPPTEFQNLHFGADGGNGSGTNRKETTGVASSQATLQQSGGLNIGIPNIAALMPILSVPIGTQFNPTQCASSASSAPHA